MNEQNRIQFNWQSTLGAIALAVSIVGISESPVHSLPEAAEGWKLAQVGVRSRINPPTPLNLRPRIHTPLPTNSRSRDYNRHSRYRGGYNRHDEYGYGHNHDCQDRCHHHGHHRGDRRSKGPIIIINPARSSRYSNYSSQDGYIRIIRK